MLLNKPFKLKKLSALVVGFMFVGTMYAQVNEMPPAEEVPGTPDPKIEMKAEEVQKEVKQVEAPAEAKQEVKKIVAAKLYNDGLALLKAKDYEKGFNVLKEAIAEAKKDSNQQVIKLATKNGAKAAYGAAKAKYKAKNYDAALNFYNESLKLDSTNINNHKGIADVYYKKKDYTKAVDKYLSTADMYAAAKKERKNKSIYKKLNVIIGKAYAKKDYAFAIDAGKRVLAKSDVASIAYYVSKAAMKNNDTKTALELAQKALDISTKEDKIKDKYYMALAEAQAKSGKKSAAIKTYQMIKGAKYSEQAKYQISQLQK